MSEFAIRGPVRILRDGMEWNDFLSPYIQAKAWVQGRDAYSPSVLVSLWPPDNPRPSFVDRDVENGVLAKKRGIPTPYPPTTLLLLSPLAELPWALAVRIWVLLSLIGIFGALFCLLSMVGMDWTESRGQVFLVLALGLAPLHTGLATGNPSVIAISLVILSTWSAYGERTFTSGSLLALAICLKPTLGCAVFFYDLLRHRWKIATIACTITALISIVSIYRFRMAGVAWFAAYEMNARNIFGVGSLADFSQADAARFNMINIQVLVHSLFNSGVFATTLSLVVPAGLFSVWLWLHGRQQNPCELLELSALLTLSLLPVYHRFYDAGLLLCPLCWSLMAAQKRSSRLFTLLLIFPFLIPGAAVLDAFRQRGRFSTASLGHWWWNGIVMAHEIWCLLFLSVLLLYFMSREPRILRRDGYYSINKQRSL